MASENLNKWAKTYDLEKTSLYPLEKCSVFLFQTKDIIRSGRDGNEDMFGRVPIYHVWENDREIYYGANMRDAYILYRRALNDGLKRSMT